jgi:hypothetical protein
MDTNHLVEQMKSFQDQVKAVDKEYTSIDQSVIKGLKSKNANDQYLTDDDLQIIFKQQVRKFMNNNVKT